MFVKFEPAVLMLLRIELVLRIVMVQVLIVFQVLLVQVWVEQKEFPEPWFSFFLQPSFPSPDVL